MRKNDNYQFSSNKKKYKHDYHIMMDSALYTSSRYICYGERENILIENFQDGRQYNFRD